MGENEPVSAYAVYQNLVHVGSKKVQQLKKNKRKNSKSKKLRSENSINCPKVDMLRKKGKNKKNVNNEQSVDACDSEGNNMKNGHSEPKKGRIPKIEEISPKNKKTGLSNQSVKVKKTKVSCVSQLKLKKKITSDCIGEKAVGMNSKIKTKTKEEKLNIKSNDEIMDSFSDGKKAFAWLIDPVMPEDFFANAWEERPLHIKRVDRNYYHSLLSTKAIDNMLRKHNIQYGKNLDITSYVDGKRETHNPVGRAYPSVVWDYYNNGCSVRLLNPQTFIDNIWHLNTALQDLFGCFVGANVYLTPPDSQGFAPHYDDIEAFILQVEGKKHWKLYAPLSSSEVLPRVSSRNFTQEEIGEPILDVVLQPGELLYFPRGVIHQGSTLPDAHSLHITISSYQRNTWGDLLEKLVPVALKVAIEEDSEFREGLPRDYLRYMGVAHSDFTSEGRNVFIEKVSNLMKRLFDHAPIDAAVDQMGKQLMHDALPPALTEEEKQCTVLGDGEKMDNGIVSNRVEFDPDVRIKLLRGNVLRLVIEDDNVRAYHCVENSREYHFLEEPQFIELSSDMAPAIEFLIHSYPAYVSVSELPMDDQTGKMQLVCDLWEKGLLITENPLDIVSD